MGDNLTKRKDIMLTVEEVRDLNAILDEAESRQGRPFGGGHFVLVEQVLRPSRTATTVKLPGASAFVKVGGSNSSNR